MRSSAVLIVMTVLLAPLAVACGNGGTGTGTAPPNAGACPADPDKVAGQLCGPLNVCPYPVCESAAKCPATTKVAYCSGATGAKWEVTTPGDAGGFTDGAITPTVDGGDAGDAADADDAADAADASETSDAVAESGSDSASPDAATDASSSDAADAD